MNKAFIRDSAREKVEREGLVEHSVTLKEGETGKAGYMQPKEVSARPS